MAKVEAIKQKLRELETQINQEQDLVKREELIKEIKVWQVEYNNLIK